MSPTCFRFGLLAFVALDRVPFTSLGISLVAKLNKNGSTLPTSNDRRGEQAIGSVRDCWFHRMTYYLGNEHSRAQLPVSLDLDPVPSAVRYRLWIAESPCGSFKRNKWDAGNVAFVFARLDNFQ